MYDVSKKSIICGDSLAKMLTQNGVETRTDAEIFIMSKKYYTCCWLSKDAHTKDGVETRTDDDDVTCTERGMAAT